MTTQSLISVFGLLFLRRLPECGIDTRGASLIVSVQITVLNLSGLVTGPILKRYPCRQLAFTGALLVTAGLFLTGYATSLLAFICTYSAFTGAYVYSQRDWAECKTCYYRSWNRIALPDEVLRNKLVFQHVAGTCRRTDRRGYRNRSDAAPAPRPVPAGEVQFPGDGDDSVGRERPRHGRGGALPASGVAHEGSINDNATGYREHWRNAFSSEGERQKRRR